MHSSSMSLARSWRLCVAGVLAATFLALDRLTKALVLASLQDGDWSMPVISGIVRFQFVANTGAAFSLGEGQGWLFVLFAAVVLVAIVVYLLQAPMIAKLEVVGLGMVAGGAIGNAFDRIVYGYVVDFIAAEFIDFPVFNVADIGVTVGVALAFVGYLFCSPATRTVDATSELNARDEAHRARVARRRANKNARK